MMGLKHIREYLSYDPETGIFTWIKRPPRGRVAVGGRAGSFDRDGYWRIKFGGKEYRASRLAWFFVHGVMPPDEMDHRNHIRDDDRLDNLRPATPGQNKQNRRVENGKLYSQFKGVCWNKGSGKWQASIYVDGRLKHLGCFDSELDAASAYDAAAAEHFGEFAYCNGVAA